MFCQRLPLYEGFRLAGIPQLPVPSGANTCDRCDLFQPILSSASLPTKAVAAQCDTVEYWLVSETGDSDSQRRWSNLRQRNNVGLLKEASRLKCINCKSTCSQHKAGRMKALRARAPWLLHQL